ncbi:alpha/beta fold hydrolase [Bacillus solimangrovi]|uniref:AB hydrolase-1 domain-containing protein n=1 Tax=Bacillus solimangrovi TaxID=1305675 RepID=A0A1E5LHM6_9BACI|nr:alpha/beta hydrolase [Bacillus solimangrovi]OEH93556.1 hypothetical protein BFG57_00780 [Bacillus solimangrovi]
MNMYYEVHKSHPSHEWICFFHGLGGSHRMFTKQLDSLKQDYNLLLFDLPGHGASGSIDDYSHKELATTVLMLMNSLHIKKAHLLGISLGTIIMQEICYKAPERVLSVINGGTAVEIKQWGYWLANIVFSPISKVVIPYLWNYKALAYLFMPKQNHKRSRHFFIQEAKKMNREDYFKWCDFVVKTNARYRYIRSKIKSSIPQVHIMGAEDHMFLEGVVRNFRPENVRIIEKCGHVCNLERAKEFNKHMVKFLQDQKVNKAERAKAVQMN